MDTEKKLTHLRNSLLWKLATRLFDQKYFVG